MNITKSSDIDKELLAKRKAFTYYYTEMILNKWLSKFNLIGLNYKQARFLLMKLWSKGSVGFCRPTTYKEMPSDLQEMLGDESLLIVDYAVADRYDIYNYPTKAMAINNRGVSFIPTTPLVIDKEIVIIYAQEHHHAIYDSIKSKIDKIVDLEMILYACNKIQKSNWAIGIDIEDRVASKGILKDLYSDNPYIVATFEQLKEVKSLVSSAPFVSDKFENMIQKNLDEIYTFLGFNNVGVLEKKEHLLDNEIEANNNVIATNNDNFLDMIEEGLERVNKVFNTTLKVELKNKEINSGMEIEEDIENDSSRN